MFKRHSTQGQTTWKQRQRQHNFIVLEAEKKIDERELIYQNTWDLASSRKRQETSYYTS